MLSEVVYPTLRHCAVVFFRRRRDWIPLVFFLSMLVILGVISSLKKPRIIYDSKVHVVYAEGIAKQEVKVRKELTDLERKFYYDDGSFRKNFTRPKEDESKDFFDWEMDFDSIKEPSVWQCAPENLNFNDTDEERDLNLCTFSDISAIVDSRIDTLKPLRLPLLRNYRNPCWYEKLSESSKYEKSAYYSIPKARKSFERVDVVMNHRRQNKHMWKLRCLPLVYIIGLPYSGSSDLYNMLIRHPFVAPAAIERANYWNENRWYMKSNFSDYLDLFDEAAEHIRLYSYATSMNNVPITHHPAITVDGSHHYFFGFKDFHNPSHRIGQPFVTPAQIIHNLTPKSDIKILLLVRNPTEWIFRSYCAAMSKSEISVDDFHSVVKEQVTNIYKCLEGNVLGRCIDMADRIKSKNNVKIHAGIYHEYIKDWIKVFPDMKVIRWEDYHSRRHSIYTKVLKYITLPPEISRFTRSSSPDTDVLPVQMLNKTRSMLDEFYRPFNELLGKLLNNPKFAYSN